MSQSARVAGLLPAGFAVAERRYPPDRLPAPDSRARDVELGRACAAQALAALGVADEPVGRADDGAPIWPGGLIGSITHCAGYAAAAVGRATSYAAVGVDAEPAAELPPGVLDVVATVAEQAMLASLARSEPGVPWDRVLFSAKESLYKAWSPLTGAWLDFAEARAHLDAAGTFRVEITHPAEAAHRIGVRLGGRWEVAGGLVLTAALVSRPSGRSS